MITIHRSCRRFRDNNCDNCTSSCKYCHHIDCHGCNHLQMETKTKVSTSIQIILNALLEM